MYASQQAFVLVSRSKSSLAFEQVSSFSHAAIIGCKVATLQVDPTHAIVTWSAMAEMVSVPVMMLVQRPKRGTSPLRMFSSTVSAMSSALCPAAGGPFGVQVD